MKKIENKMKTKLLLSIPILALFMACAVHKPLPLSLEGIKKEVDKSLNKRDLRGKHFMKLHNAAFDLLTEDILKNDTLIFIESYNQNLYTLYVYKSGSKDFEYYITKSTLVNGRVHTELVRSEFYKFAEEMVEFYQDNGLEEMKRRGDAASLVPVTRLIINVGIKDNDKYNFQSVITREFWVNYNQ